MDEDYLLAVRLQEQFNQVSDSGRTDDENAVLGQWLPKKADTSSSSSSNGSDKWSVVDPRWEMIDPLPDARALFLQFNDKYFWGRLAGVEVRWSPRMTLCAGLCCYEGHGGLCSVRLSEPLLKLRPRSDFVNTLLHEMIHAYLFVTANNTDHDGHGPEFHKHMYRINKDSGSSITVYHTFHDEVANYKQHWWKCDGPCQKWGPYYGMVKRAMNRAPHPRDPWFPDHQRKCGGTYHKVKEPEGYGQKKPKKKEEAKSVPPPGSKDIRKMFNPEGKTKDTGRGGGNNLSPNVSFHPDIVKKGNGLSETETIQPPIKFPGSGKIIGGDSKAEGKVVRRIPGIGIITSGRPAAATATVSKADDCDILREPTTRCGQTESFNGENRKSSFKGPSGSKRKRGLQGIFTDSDSDNDLLLPVRKKKKKNTEGRFGKHGLLDCMSPGTSMKIPGFKSVSNRSSDPAKLDALAANRNSLAASNKSSHPSKSDPIAANRNSRAMGLGSSTEDSDGEDCIPLASVIKKERRNANSEIFIIDDSYSPVDVAPDNSITIDDSPPTRTDSNHNTAITGPSVNLTAANLPGMAIPPIDPVVNCPVCSAEVPSYQINIHLDSCLS